MTGIWVVLHQFSLSLSLSNYTFAGYDPLITLFGFYGDGLDKKKQRTYRYNYIHDRILIFCATSNSTHALADWYYANGTRIGVRDRSFRVGHFPNGTAVLQIADDRPLSYCDGGTYTCVVNATSGYSETRNFTLFINCKFT